MSNFDKLRRDFPILKRRINGHPLVYFDNAATTQKPQAVIDSLVDFYGNHNANIHRGIHTLSQEASEMVDRARALVARFVDVDVEEIVFTRNATEGINILMHTWAETNLKQGDAIVITGLEHHANLVTWQVLAQKKGLELRVVRFDSEGRIILTSDEPVSKKDNLFVGSLEQLLDEKVKLVAMSHCSNVLGTITDPKIVQEALEKKKLSAFILLDASQSVPHFPVSFTKLGVDAAVFSGHKMLGPTGVGVFWAKRKHLEAMPPFMLGGDMISEVTLEKTTFNEPPYKFEAGTPDIAGIIGLGAAIEYLSRIGMENIWRHEQELTKYSLAKLMPYVESGLVELYGLKDTKDRVGVISFNIKGVHAHDTAQVLDHFGIAVRSGQHCAAPLLNSLGLLATARASFYFYNTTEEVDRLIEVLPKVKETILG